MNEPHFPLDRLLDEAAAGYHPTPDPARLQGMLGSHRRRRGFVLFSSAAACLVLLGGTALAFRNNESAPKLSPAVEGEFADSTGPKVTEPRTTEPKLTAPDNTEPKVTEPKVTEPKATEPPSTGETEPPKPIDPPATAPKSTEPKTTEPKTTEPKPTNPPSTEPKPTDPPVTGPTTTKPAETGSWSAYQSYGFCEEDPPFEVFYGTAQPGAVVNVSSDFGGGSTAANESGQWELTVYFSGAPLNQKFKVWVSSGENLAGFWFKVLG
jgi:hypothetical protein